MWKSVLFLTVVNNKFSSGYLHIFYFYCPHSVLFVHIFYYIPFALNCGRVKRNFLRLFFPVLFLFFHSFVVCRVETNEKRKKKVSFNALTHVDMEKGSQNEIEVFTLGLVFGVCCKLQMKQLTWKKILSSLIHLTIIRAEWIQNCTFYHFLRTYLMMKSITS